MHDPNRYGNPVELAAYIQGMPVQYVAEMVRRDPRTVRDWLSGKRPIPWWVPELLRLRAELHAIDMRRMGLQNGAGGPATEPRHAAIVPAGRAP